MPWLIAGEITAKELGRMSRLGKAFVSASDMVEGGSHAGSQPC